MTDVMEAPAPEDISADATLNRDGSVRKKPGPKPGTPRKAARAKAPGYKAPAAPRKAPGNDFRPAILGLLQLPQLGFTLAAKFAKTDEAKTALTLDGLTVGIHSPNIAEALNTTAQTDEKLAKVLDKLATVGPYSLVISALMVPAFQCLANHGVVPTNEAMGVLPPDQLVAVAQAMQ